MNITSIHDQAMLAYVSVSCWSARKLDRKASKQVTKDAKATDDAARVNKYLLASADESLKELQRIGGQVRKFLDSHSLPWDDAGNRLLSNQTAMSIIGDLYEYVKQFNAKADEFADAYPVLRAQALHNLGDMGDDQEYPQPDRIREKFTMRLSLSPIPTGFSDLRTGLSPDQVQALQAHCVANITSQVNDALRSAWERLRGDVAKVAERMALSPEGERKIFKNSLIENLRETCDILDSLNVFDSDEMKVMCRYVREHIALPPETLRTQVTAAEQVRLNAEAALKRMQEWM